MTAPAVSVIIIFLNAERWISEAIASVRAQSFADWELLLVDDGSRDEGTALARSAAAREPDRVRYLEHPGHQTRGMSAARNLGLRHARGQAVAFCDADDVCLPDKLARQTALLAAHPEAGMVASAMEYWFSWTGAPTDRARDHVPRSGLPAETLIRPPDLLLRFLRNETRSPGTCSVLVRHAVATTVGGFEARFRGMYEDQAFLAKVCLSSPVLVTDDVVARYRQYPASAYARARAAGVAAEAELVYLEWLAREVFSRHHREQGPSWDALRALPQLHWHHGLRRLNARSRRIAAALRAHLPGRRGG